MQTVLSARSWKSLEKGIKSTENFVRGELEYGTGLSGAVFIFLQETFPAQKNFLFHP
jgi:hypothetical protein